MSQPKACNTPTQCLVTERVHGELTIIYRGLLVGLRGLIIVTAVISKLVHSYRVVRLLSICTYQLKTGTASTRLWVQLHKILKAFPLII